MLLLLKHDILNVENHKEEILDMIEIDSLSFSYGKKQIFSDFSLHIPKGQCCLISGVNGMGKTTLLRLISGALRPDKGNISFKGLSNPKQQVALISDSLSLFENLKVKDMILLHQSIYKLPKLSLELVERIKIDSNVVISNLSAGQRTILLLDLMLATQPEVLLIDEVLPALDAYMREQFLNYLQSQQKKRNMTIVTVNLNFHDMERFAERIVLLKHGVIEVDEDIENLKNSVKRYISVKKPTDYPIILQKPRGNETEFYLYPCTEKGSGFESLSLTEIVSVFIGATYV